MNPGTLRIEPEPKRPDLDVQRIEKWRQVSLLEFELNALSVSLVMVKHVAKAILVEARNPDGSENIEGVSYCT